MRYANSISVLWMLAFATWTGVPQPAAAGVIKEVVLKPVNGTGGPATDVHMSFTGIAAVGDVSQVTGPFTGEKAVSMIGGTTFISLEAKGAENVGNGAAGTFKFMLDGTKNLATKSVSWSDATGLLLPKVPAPAFTLNGDPVLTLSDQLDDGVSIGISDLRFALNVDEIPLASLDFGTIPDLGAPQPSFILSPSGSGEPFDLGTLQPGKFDYAQGNVYDPSTSQFVDSFIIGIEGVPEPAPWALMLIGFGCLGAALRRRGLSSAPAHGG